MFTDEFHVDPAPTGASNILRELATRNGRGKHTTAAAEERFGSSKFYDTKDH
jgi:hypothetical protein